MRRFLYSVVFGALLAATAGAAEWYVAPDGSDNNNGGRHNPWSLRHALRAPSQVEPGDTIWLRGGTYAVKKSLAGRLIGTAEKPIKVRQYPGERATVDFGDARACLVLQGAHTWYMGFELMSSAATRWLEVADYGKRGSPGAELNGNGNKLINLVIHDTNNCGVGGWPIGANAEINGCLIYYTGFDSPVRGHGHGIYVESSLNDSTPKLLKDNIVFDNYSLGFQVYESSNHGHVNNFELAGNISFNNGIVSITNHGHTNIQFLVGCHVVGRNDNIHDNIAYTFPTTQGTGMSLGQIPKWGGKQLDSLILKDNYLVGDVAYLYWPLGRPVIAGNTFYGRLGSGQGADVTQYPGNTYSATRPTSGVRVFIRPNDYEPGRANVCVFNWDGADSAKADVSNVLKAGEAYEVRDAQDFFGSPAATGTYSGGSITIPLHGASAPVAKGFGTPDHFAQPQHTPKEFNAFVLLRK